MKNQSPDTHCSQIESLLNPLTMRERDKEREGRAGEREREENGGKQRERGRERERNRERCKIERITNECTTEREP